MIIYLLCLALFCVGLYCILRKRNIIKIIVGIIIAEYAVNLFFILVSYQKEGRSPVFSADQTIENMVDALPQAVVLTLRAFVLDGSSNSVHEVDLALNCGFPGG